MRIDDHLEPMVREALAASVAGEGDRFDQALERIADQGDVLAGTALALTLSIGSTALHAIHQRQPTQDQIAYLAKTYAESESWADIDPSTALELLAAMTEGRSALETLDAGEAARAAFAMGGWLLAGFLPEGKDWTDFLDEILDALERTPD